MDFKERSKYEKVLSKIHNKSKKKIKTVTGFVKSIKGEEHETDSE